MDMQAVQFFYKSLMIALSALKSSQGAIENSTSWRYVLYITVHSTAAKPPYRNETSRDSSHNSTFILLD